MNLVLCDLARKGKLHFAWWKKKPLTEVGGFLGFDKTCAMKTKPTFCAALLLSLPLLPGCPAPSTPKPAKPAVSLANFRSVTWLRTGGYAGFHLQTRVVPGQLQFLIDPENKKAPQSKSLSKAELQSLIKVLNAANFPKIAGQYSSSGMMDGFKDVVTLVLQEPGKKPVTFVVDSYGDKAPKAFGQFLDSLYDLRKKKIPHDPNDSM